MNLEKKPVLVLYESEELINILRKQAELLLQKNDFEELNLTESLDKLTNVLKTTKTLVVTKGEIPLLLVLPQKFFPLDKQMVCLSYQSNPGIVALHSRIQNNDAQFDHRQPYIYLGIDCTNRGDTPQSAIEEISANNRRPLSAEGLIALARELPDLFPGNDLMSLSSFTLQFPITLKLEEDGISKNKRHCLNFHVHNNEFLPKNKWVHPSAQRRITIRSSC